MIIKRLVAENILKYRRLELSDLPVRGRIAISGPNESGKTAIGETICLALFGRTFSLRPEQLTKAIRWGEFRGSILLEFTGRDEQEYILIREIDCDGDHTVRLYRIIERDPYSLAQLTQNVTDIIGFGYDRFVDSFYLAQREIELPGARSTKLKALIGVDCLEATARRFRDEAAATTTTVAELEAEVAAANRERNDLAIDEAKLARLEAQQEEATRSLAAADEHVTGLLAGEQTVSAAAETLRLAVKDFVHTPLATRYTDWRTRHQGLKHALATAEAAGDVPGVERDPSPLHATAAALAPFENALAEYEKLHMLATLHRDQLARSLRIEHNLPPDDTAPHASRPHATNDRAHDTGPPGDQHDTPRPHGDRDTRPPDTGPAASRLRERHDASPPSTDASAGAAGHEPGAPALRRAPDAAAPGVAPDAAPADAESPHTGREFPDFTRVRADLIRRTSDLDGVRGPLMVVTPILAVLAAVVWAGWLVFRFAPASALSAWVRDATSLTVSGTQTASLMAAAACTAVVGLLVAVCIRIGRKRRALSRRIADLDADAEHARKAIDAVDALKDRPTPAVLAQLADMNNALLQGAVAAFTHGEGAVLCQPNAHAAALAEVRRCAEAAQKSLHQMLKRMRRRVRELRANIKTQRGVLEQLAAQIAAEQDRRCAAASIDARLETLEGRVAGLHREIDVRELACKLLDGTCRHVQSRFHPELRRFAGKVLPQITNQRYRHLQIDDDLNVRVFSNEKNDFVGLDEVSNGTHRQLMLCLRLALSQALIASTTKAPQFIFFDEPFAFFDRERMHWAIDVLRKLSPQLTQVWLAAQDFDDPDAFEVAVPCEVGVNEIVVSAQGAQPDPDGAGSTIARIDAALLRQAAE